MESDARVPDGPGRRRGKHLGVLADELENFIELRDQLETEVESGSRSSYHVAATRSWAAASGVMTEAKAIATRWLPSLQLRFKFCANVVPGTARLWIGAVCVACCSDRFAMPLGTPQLALPTGNPLPEFLHVVDLLGKRQFIEPGRRYRQRLSHV